MRNLFNNIMFAIMVIVFAIVIWFFFVYILILVGIVILLFVVGVIPVEVTYKDGTKEKYKIGDVIKLWRSK